MYNRYIPQPDGSYRRRPADVPQSAPPPRPEPPRQEPPRRNPDFCPPPEPQGKPPCQENPPCSHQRRQERPAPPPPPRRKPPQQPPQDSFLGIGNFLHQLLPKDFCMEDLMVVLLLLLMSGTGEEDQNFALLTLGLYLFLERKYAGFRRVETNPAYFLLRKREYCGRMVNTLLQEDST